MTVKRPQAMQEFLDAITFAADRCVTDHNAKVSLSKIREALQTPSKNYDEVGTQLPIRDNLEEVANPQCFHRPELRHLIETFLRLEPMLTWRRRSGDMSCASENFADGHANANIIGPGGIERRTDVWLGVTLLAPNVRYPDHSHPPEETYLVLSNGAFCHGDSEWFEPGIGGTFYNSPGIVHAMRSDSTPLLAFWLLWAGTK
ncbi:dimethylsulfonioproprionate lyase family protein [Parasedimentitalea maritima]|uniref:Transcriptional regulator n=1 Tax=Parasedimentitalea maritima TaxID=2578117 RepID=A0A6A4RB89_9RHOB|nr:dimethylsulfonioproprionate lyase family protein [Zongyanglinia marina]KAE9627462.1 transcriptional regulator [Zongyanglinia marina]